MRLKSVILMGIFGLVAGAVPLIALSRDGAGSGRLPPIGQRDYVVGGQDKYAPVVIKKAGREAPKMRFLKDPVQPSREAKVEPMRPAPAKKPKPRLVQRERPGRLRFGKLAVQGHLTRPRVEFTRDRLPVERADEPVGQDFFPKVFAPAQDDAF